MHKVINHFAKVLCFLCLLLSYSSYAQYTFTNHSDIAKVKSGTTLIVVKDTTSAATMQYERIVKKYWTQSKFKFVLENDLKNYNLSNNATLKVLPYDRVYSSSGPNGSSYSTGSSSSTTIVFKECLQLKIGEDELTNIELFRDGDKDTTRSFSDSLPQYDWGPGILKNYIQSITTYLVTSAEKKISDKVAVISRLHELKTRVLYIPDYLLMKYPINGEVKYREAEKLMSKYPYPYKVLTATELNKMIMDSTNGIYYALYDPPYMTVRALAVINSATGFVVYYDFPIIQVPELHEGDFRKLAKQIDDK